MVVIRWAAADTPPSAVAGLFDRPATCTIIGTPTRAMLTPGMETVAPGMETVAPGMETVAPGMETVAPGMETVTGADMAKARSTSAIIIVFPLDSFRTGIQGGDTTITDITGTLITRITRMTIPIIITPTPLPTLAETDQRASQCWFKTRLLGAVTTMDQSMGSLDPELGARSASFSGIMACQ
jgi:hypothetical protein